MEYSFAAPNMTAVGHIGGTAVWQIQGMPGRFDQGATFCFEAWVKLVGPNSVNAQLLVKPNEFAFYIANGRVTAGWMAGANISGGTKLQPDTWYHVAAVYDGANLIVYLDGAPDGQIAYSGPGSPTTSSSFSIGATGGDSCDIWDLTVYNSPQTPEQVSASLWEDLKPSTSLVAHFDFSTAPAKETVANYGLTPQGGASSLTVAPCIQLDGISSGIIIADDAPPPLPSTFSVSAWVGCTSFQQAVQTIFSFITTQNPPQAYAFFSIGIGNQAGATSIFAGVPPDGITVPVSLSLGDWHNIAVTCDGGIVILYLDGQPIGTFGTSFAGIPADLWTVGFDTYNKNKENWFNGGVQWLSVWGRCLTPAEVAFQQYGSVSDNTGILVDISLDVQPPIDLANNLSVQLGGAAAPLEQRVPVTVWNPPPAQLNPPDGGNGEVPLLRTNWSTPKLPAGIRPDFSNPEQVVADGLKNIDTLLAGYDPSVASNLKHLYESRVRKVFAEIKANPELATPGRWVREGAEDVYRYRYPDGHEEVIFRALADALTTCQMWWLSFVSTMVLGILNLFFISITGKEMNDWLQKYFLGNRDLMARLTAIWVQYPTFTGFTVIAMLGAIYAASLLRSLLWFVAYKIGYWGLAKLFTKLVLWISPAAPAQTVLFAASAALLAVQLGLQVTGGPGVPGYSQSCSSMEELPASTVPALA